MGSNISIIDSPAGKSVAGNVYLTTVKMELSCIGYGSQDDDLQQKILRTIWMQPRDHTRPTQWCKNKGGFRVLIKPGLKIQLIDFREHKNPETGTGYELCFVIIEDIAMDQVIEFNDCLSRTSVTGECSLAVDDQ